MSRLSEAFGLDDQSVDQVPAQIIQDMFFTKLAEFGYTPANEQEALELLELSDALEDRQVKIAQAPTSGSVVSYGLRLLRQTEKFAGASDVAADERIGFEHEVANKTAMYLQTPEMFAAGLALIEKLRSQPATE